MPVFTNANSTDTYMDLVAQFPLRRLKSAAEHKKAKKIVLRLSKSDLDAGALDYLDVLVNLIKDYERQAMLQIDSSFVSAADLIRHRLHERGMTVTALAREIGVPQSNLSDMLNGKRAWSKTAIRVLVGAMKIDAKHFLR